MRMVSNLGIIVDGNEHAYAEFSLLVAPGTTAPSQVNRVK